jgi:Heavy-metal-associated domain
VRVALKDVNGVTDVNVSLNKGLATVTLAPDNTTTVQQLHNAITKNGFTTKQAVVSVRGELRITNGAMTLEVSGTKERYRLEPEAGAPGIGADLANKRVIVEGTIPEIPKDKPPDLLRYRTVQEQE